eukprot:3336552-Rhodomonas_salina.1
MWFLAVDFGCALHWEAACRPPSTPTATVHRNVNGATERTLAACLSRCDRMILRMIAQDRPSSGQ